MRLIGTNSLLAKLFNVGSSTPRSGTLLTNPLIPEIKRTRRTQATIEVGPSHLSTRMNHVPLMRVEERRLERNKYAPWGRGDLSGLPV